MGIYNVFLTFEGDVSHVEASPRFVTFSARCVHPRGFRCPTRAFAAAAAEKFMRCRHTAASTRYGLGWLASEPHTAWLKLVVRV